MTACRFLKELATVPSARAPLALLSAGKTRLRCQDGDRREEQSESGHHRHHGTGRYPWSQEVRHFETVSLHSSQYKYVGKQIGLQHLPECVFVNRRSRGEEGRSTGSFWVHAPLRADTWEPSRAGKLLSMAGPEFAGPARLPLISLAAPGCPARDVTDDDHRTAS